ncbi:MAG: histidine phosphatase family protein [Oscillospiraceae bacterium]|nr:histidine phosphatase family protein [Oscillospiraceae bacterium]
MTTIYFIRHAQSDYSVRDAQTRPLTEKGLADRVSATAFLSDKNIDKVLSSPFKRAVDTVADFAEKFGFEIETIDDFRERRSDLDKLRTDEDFSDFMKKQWADFSYTMSDGECLAEVQERNIAALEKVLINYKDKNIVIGTHGTALSVIINYYDNTYGYEDFMEMVDKLPWAVKMTFSENRCINIEKIDLL